MPRQKQNKERWEIGLQAAVSKNGKRRGWSVSEHNGRTRLRLQFPKAGEWPANAQTNLPYAWDADSVDDIVLLINRIYTPVMGGEVTLKAAIAEVLATSDKKADLVVSPWGDIVQAFRDYKLNFGNRIAPKTFEASYERYLSVALLHLQGRETARTGKELMQMVLSHQRANQKPGIKQGEELKRWIDMPKSRLECCLALKKFLEYAVTEHRQPKAFLISDKDYLEVRGADGKSRKKAVLTDAEVLELIRLLPESWGNVVKISRVFGVRPWEIAFIARATNDDGNHQLRVIKGKTFTTRSGVKEETEPRWIEAVAVDNSTFGLVEGWDQLKLPPTVTGKTLGNVLRRLPYWQQLVAEYEARGEWLRPYSLRDTFSVRAHGIVKDDTLIAAAMGHTVEVHHRSYRTSEWRSVRKAFEEAS
jgi:integrase